MSTHPLWSKANHIFQCPNDNMWIQTTKVSWAITMYQALCKEPRETEMDLTTFTSIHRRARVMLRYKLVPETVGDKRGDAKFCLWELRKSSQRRWNLRWILTTSKCCFPVGAVKKAYTLPTCIKLERVQNTSTIAWKSPWTEEPGKLQSTGSQRVGHDWATSLHFTLSKVPWLGWSMIGWP